MRPILCAVLLALTLPLLAAESAAGRWDGSISLPNGKLEIHVDLEGSAAAWKGDIDIPAQGARDLPLTNIAVEGEKVSFEIAGVPGAPSFRGTLTGDALAGDFTQGGMTFPFALARGQKADVAARLAGLDEFVGGALRSWDVPGISLAVVADGKVVWSRGFGQRDVANKLPMTADTLLPIGSITKSFTTVLLGMLVDEGKLDWDKPVRDYLPEFRGPDDTLTAHLTPRDLVTHRSGLPRHDLVWYNNQDLTRQQLVGRLAHLSTSEDLRARFQYNNLTFLAAGFLVEKLTGKPWEEVARERLLTPLAMKRSTFSDADAAKDPDHARGYREEDGTIRVLPFREVGNMGPAGSISSSANEMANYALLQLGRGRFGERQLVQPATLREMHTPQVAVGALPDQPEIGPASYGMGWAIDTYRGRLRVHHSGGIDGFTALLTLFPNDGVAIVALANANGTELPGVVSNHIADRMLNFPPRDWNLEALGRRGLARKAQKDAEKKKASTRRAGTRPSHAIAEYAGDYENPGYGVLRIEALSGNELRATYNHIATPLEHWHYDTWNGRKNEDDPTFEDMKYLFWTDFAGNISAVEAAFEPRVDPIVFHKRPDARLSDAAYLATFAGEYVLGAQPITLSLRGNRLVMTIANQPPYELLPDIDGWFNLEGLTGFRARLTPEALELSQPNGLFTATRRK